MIWHRGRLIPADALHLSPLDRAFEHGLGLFETLRSWNGQVPLLRRHLARMRSSARSLGLVLDDAELPDERAAAALLRNAGNSDQRLRITLTGGLSSAGGRQSLLWMTAGPLPVPLLGKGAIVNRTLDVSFSDPLARHKTLNYWRMRLAHEHAVQNGEDEALCVTPDGRVHQGTRTNIVYVESGSLVTPSDDGPVLPGIMRDLVMEHARIQGLATKREPTTLARLRAADEAFLTSSARGIVPLTQLLDRRWQGPGPLTAALWNRILPWLESGGEPP